MYKIKILVYNKNIVAIAALAAVIDNSIIIPPLKQIYYIFNLTFWKESTIYYNLITTFKKCGFLRYFIIILFLLAI